MGRLLVLLGLLALAAWLIKRIYLSAPEKQPTTSAEHALMKKCVYCDLHLPESQGIENEKGQFFCSTEHLEHHKNKA